MSETKELRLFPTRNDIKEYYHGHSFAYEGDAGIDLYFPDEVVIQGNSTALVNLGVICEMKDGLGRNFSYLLMPRSSIYKTPLRMSNSIGLIDAAYRGLIKVPLDNISNEPYTITKGQRLMQIVAGNLDKFRLVVVNSISDSERGSNGFGSSGK